MTGENKSYLLGKNDMDKRVVMKIEISEKIACNEYMPRETNNQAIRKHGREILNPQMSRDYKNQKSNQNFNHFPFPSSFFKFVNIPKYILGMCSIYSHVTIENIYKQNARTGVELPNGSESTYQIRHKPRHSEYPGFQPHYLHGLFGPALLVLHHTLHKYTNYNIRLSIPMSKRLKAHQNTY